MKMYTVSLIIEKNNYKGKEQKKTLFWLTL